MSTRKTVEFTLVKGEIRIGQSRLMLYSTLTVRFSKFGTIEKALTKFLIPVLRSFIPSRSESKHSPDFEPNAAGGPQSTEVFAGDSVTLSCDIPDSNPPVHVSMYKEGEETEVDENSPRYRV